MGLRRWSSRGLLGVFVAAACSGDDEGPAGTGTGTGTGGADHSGDSEPPACETPEVLTLDVSADTTVLPTACNMTIAYGGSDFLQLGTPSENPANAAFGLVRFDLTAQDSAAVFGPGVVRATLSLQANVDCDLCGPDGVEAKAGELRAHVLRNDWVEGENSPYGGADFCRRTDGMDGLGWGYPDTAAGSTTAIAEGVDYAGAAGSQTFADGAASVAVQIDAAQIEPIDGADDGALSLLLESPSGILMAASRENDSGAARLDVEFCP